MDIRHLEYFLQVLKDKNITKAAKSLYLTQPALSKALKKLENDLGYTLFVKTPRGIEPTDYGIQLANSSAPLVEAFAHIEEQLHDFAGLKKGQVNVGIGPMFGFAYLCEIMKKFEKEYPNIRIIPRVLSSQKTLSMLHNYDLDIVIAHTGSEHDKNVNYDTLEKRLIDEDTIVLACNKKSRLCSMKKISIGDIKDEIINMCSSDYALRESIIQYLTKAGIQPKLGYECNSIELLLDMTISGNKICLLPQPYLKKISKCFPEMKILKISPSLPLRTYIWMRKGSYNSYSSITFASFVENYFKKSKKTTSKKQESTK